MNDLQIDMVHATLETGYKFGLILFLIKWITVDVLSSLGREIDNWHNPVSRLLPVPNDLFAAICLIASITCYYLLRVGVVRD